MDNNLIPMKGDEPESEKGAGKKGLFLKILKGTGSFLFRHKVLIIFLIIAVIGGSYAYRFYRGKQAAQSIMQRTSVETAEIESRSLLNYISATGTVESISVKSVSSSLKDYEITSLLVKEGDTIEKGDVIATFDTSDIVSDIAEVKEDIEKNKELDSLSQVTADRELAYTRVSLADDIASADKTIADAAEALAEACDGYGDAKQELSDAKDTRDKRQSEYNDAKDSYNKLLEIYNQETNATAGLSENSADAAAANRTVSSSEVETAKTKMQEAQTALTSAENAVTSADNKVSSAYSTEQNAEKTYEDAIENRDKTGKTAANSEASQEETYQKTLIDMGSEVDSLEKQLEEYEKQLSKGTLTAPIGGTVTSVSAEEGDTYDGGELITIQNVDELLISAEIDEYDISDVTLGMRVVIKTDATRDEELEGEITYIAPVSSQTDSTSSDVTYRVEIGIAEQEDISRLRIGMSAKLNIVLEEKNDVLTVPYDAVDTNNEGESVIRVMEDRPDVSANSISEGSVQEGTADDRRGEGQAPEGDAAAPVANQREIIVETGMEDDYYIEIISDEIEEGMQVVISSGTDNSTGAQESGMPGGMPGGGMPGGRGGF